MQPFEARILRKILPSADEDRRIREVVREILRTLEPRIAAKGLHAKPLLVGSVFVNFRIEEAHVEVGRNEPSVRGRRPGSPPRPTR